MPSHMICKALTAFCTHNSFPWTCASILLVSCSFLSAVSLILSLYTASVPLYLVQQPSTTNILLLTMDTVVPSMSALSFLHIIFLLLFSTCIHTVDPSASSAHDEGGEPPNHLSFSPTSTPPLLLLHFNVVSFLPPSFCLLSTNTGLCTVLFWGLGIRLVRATVTFANFCRDLLDSRLPRLSSSSPC